MRDPGYQITRTPIDDSVYVERPLAGPKVVEQCLESAGLAQQEWRRTSLPQRAACCHAMVDALLDNSDEIAEQLCWMMGRPIRYASLELKGMAERARHMIEIATTALAPVDLAEKTGFTRYIKREPHGVVLVIAPWNYPYLTAINVIVPAIMAGNSVILKHSKQTPLCAEQFANGFRQGSLPPACFQYLHLDHQGTEALAADPRIHHIAFTGSVAAGRRIEQTCAGRFVSVGLELGGKDPAYVRHDADLDAAVASCMEGAYFNSGQSCCAIERIYVDRQLYSQFVHKAVASVYQLQLGRPDDPATTLGPLISAKAAEQVRGQIRDAIGAGAIAHIDEADFSAARPGSAYLAPQLLTGVNHGMRIMQQETFGPVVGIMAVDDDTEAIALMNDSEFGLTASVFTRDLSAAQQIGEQLHCGTVFMNRCDYLDPGLAWSGVKNSGRGCTLSNLGYESLTRPKSFHLKHGP